MKRALPSLALLVAACGPATQSSGSASPGQCEVAVRAAPSGTAASDAKVPESQLVLELRASTRALAREIEKRVPRTLASVRDRPSGAVGNVTYSVTRGPIAVSLDGDKLVTTVPVSAEVEVCKPLGPLCIRYGACSPRLSARASVPLLLQPDYNMRRARASVALTRGCVIAGFDAGPEIRKIARRQIGGIEARINDAVPEFRPYVGGAWQLLHVPLALSRDTCLKILPGSLAQSPPKQEDNVIVLRLGAKARASFEEPCREPPEAAPPPPLPTLKHDGALPEQSTLRVPLRLGWPEVSAALSRSVRGAPGETRMMQVRASGENVSGVARMRLDVTLSGRVCGEGSFSVEPYFDVARGVVRVRDARPLNAPAANDHPLRTVARALERAASVPVAVDTSVASRGLEAAVKSAVEGLPQGVVVDLDVEPARIAQVAAEGRGLLSLLEVRGKAAARMD